jgi:hypothetical protein
LQREIQKTDIMGVVKLEKVKFENLSFWLKAIIVYGFIQLVLDLLTLLIGFLDGYAYAMGS